MNDNRHGSIKVERDTEDWMVSHKLQFMMEQGVLTAFGSLIVVIVIIWQNWFQIETSRVTQVWMACALALDVGNLIFCWLYKRRYHWFPDQTWLQIYRGIVLSGGTLTGLIVVMFFKEASLAMQTLNIFIIVGFPATAIGTLSVDKHAYFFYMIPVTVIATIYFLLSDDRSLMGLGVLFMMFTVLMSRISILTGGIMRSNINMARTMEYRASHDPLVKLYNRVELENRFETQAPASKRAVAMLFVDLDNFKPLNDTLGHQAGDDALIAVADVIKASIRSDDIAARLGGDEFVVVLFVHQLEEAEVIAQTILQGIDALEFGEAYAGLSASVGIGFHDESQVSFSGLMRVADLALYKSKISGKNQVTINRYRQKSDSAFLSTLS